MLIYVKHFSIIAWYIVLCEIAAANDDNVGFSIRTTGEVL